MKKILLLLLLLVTFFAGYSFIFKKVPQLEPASFLPEDTIVYNRQSDFSTLLDQIKESKLGKAVDQMDFALLAKEIGGSQEEADNVVKLEKDIKAAINNPLFKEMFGEKFIVALLPVQESEIGSNSLKNIFLDHLLVISQPSHSVKVVETIARLIPSASGKSTQKYKGNEITSFVVDDSTRVYMTSLNNLCFLSFSQTILEQSIDLRDSDQKRLVENDQFKRFQTRFADDQSFSFVQVPAFVESGKKLVNVFMPDGKDEINKGMDDLRCYSFYASGATVDDFKKISTHTVVGINDQFMDENMRKLIIPPVEDNTLASLLSKDMVFYYWANTFDVQAMYDMTISDMQMEEEQAAMFNSQIEAVTGVSASELFAVFDSQVSFFMKNFSLENAFPEFDLGVVMKLQDQNKCKTIINKLLSDNHVPVTEKNHDGQTMYCVTSTPFMQPGYAVVDDLLILASSETYMSSILDTIKKGGRKETSAGFIEVTKDFDSPSNMIVYIQLDEYIKMIRQLIDWSGGMLLGQNQESAEKFQLFTDQIINPLFDGLSIYKQLGYRTFVKDNELNIETVTLLNEGSN